MKTPIDYRMPAEWEPHAGTWLTWPHNPETWPNQDMAQVESDYLQIVKALAQGEQTHILVQDKSAEEDLHKKPNDSGVQMDQVFLYDIPTNDSWIRDYGPNFLVSGKDVAINDWDFDSWEESINGNSMISRVASLPNSYSSRVLNQE